jgi:hypothetical protein
MAFYIVVHHPFDPNRLWANEWEAQTLLRSITTPKNIAVRWRRLKLKASVSISIIHRWVGGPFPAEICCSALISEVHDLDKTTVIR